MSSRLTNHCVYAIMDMFRRPDGPTGNQGRTNLENEWSTALALEIVMTGYSPNKNLFDPHGVPFSAAASAISAASMSDVAGPLLAVLGIDTNPELPQPAAPYDPYAPMPADYGYGPGWADAK